MLTITLAHVLRTKRREAGLTQRKLAEMTDIPRPRISEFENGRKFPNRDHLYRLSGPLKLDLDFLLRLSLPAPTGRPEQPANWRVCQVFRSPTRYRPPKERDSAVRISAARHAYPEVRTILRQLQARDDWLHTRRFFLDLWCDSRVEGRAWLGLLSDGARAAQIVPYRRAFEQLTIVDPVTREIVGARATGALFWQDPAPTLLIPQMTLLTPTLGPCRVDAVVCVKDQDGKRYLVVEIDGNGHDFGDDPARESALAELGLRVMRLEEKRCRQPGLGLRISEEVLRT